MKAIRAAISTVAFGIVMRERLALAGQALLGVPGEVALKGDCYVEELQVHGPVTLRLGGRLRVGDKLTVGREFEIGRGA